MAAVAPGARDEQERARTELASSFKSRLSLCSSELTSVRRSTRDGEMLLSNTSPINPKIMYGFEATAATVEDPQREPVLLLGTLRQTKKTSTGPVREAEYRKPASTHNGFVRLTRTGVAWVQRIGYAVALTAGQIASGCPIPAKQPV